MDQCHNIFESFAEYFWIVSGSFGIVLHGFCGVFCFFCVVDVVIIVFVVLLSLSLGGLPPAPYGRKKSRVAFFRRWYQDADEPNAGFNATTTIMTTTTAKLLRREKSFCKIFREVFRSFCEVFQSFRKFFEVFASFSRLSDPFGPIGMHSDAFGSNWKRLDVFENF